MSQEQAQRVCKIKIGKEVLWDITRDQDITWGVTSGVQPQTLNILIPASVIMGAKNGGALATNKVVKTGEAGTDPPPLGVEPATLTINNLEYKELLVVDDRWASNTKHIITIADRRWLWQFKLCVSPEVGSYIFNQVKFDGIAQNFSSFSSASVNKNRYVASSLDDTAGPLGTTPWTALRLLQHIFKAETGEKLKLDKIKDNNYYQDNMNYIGLSFPKVIHELCQKCNGIISLKDDEFYLGTEDDDTYNDERVKTNTVAGKIFKQGSAIRPGDIELTFVKLKEFEFANDMTAKWGLQNVMEMPFSSDETGPISGEEYKRGDYLPWNNVLSYFGISYTDFLKRYPAKDSVVLGMGLLAASKVQAFKGVGKSEKQRRAIIIIQELFASFRTLWRMDEETFDKLLRISPYRSATVDAYTKARKPSELDEDWSAEMGTVLENQDSTFLTNFKRSSSMKSPTILSFDNTRGLVTFRWGRYPFNIFADKWHGILVEESKLVDYARWKAFKLEKFAKPPALSERYRFNLILSAYELDDFTYTKTATIKYKDGGTGSKNPSGKKGNLTFQKFITRENARVNIDGDIVNDDTLDLILNFERDLAEYLWRYKPTGSKTVGYSPELTRLHGVLKQIAHTVSAKGDTTTIIASPASSFVPDYGDLPPEFRTAYFNTLGG